MRQFDSLRWIIIITITYHSLERQFIFSNFFYLGVTYVTNCQAMRPYPLSCMECCYWIINFMNAEHIAYLYNGHKEELYDD